MHRIPAIAACVLTLCSGAALAQSAPPAAQPARVEAPTMIANPYTAFEFLLGDWYTRPTEGPDMAIHQKFEWGPNKSYIRYSTLTAERGKPEALHFEGILVWNGATRKLDYLIVSEPGSGAQEQGTMHVEADGSIVRDVTLTRADGKISHFRQTFRSTGPNSAMTSLMRQTASGWEPNFPGSDNLPMSRSPN